MSGKKKSATKKTAQEIREMVACLEEAHSLLQDYKYGTYGSRSWTIEEATDNWQARANKILGNPK